MHCVHFKESDLMKIKHQIIDEIESYVNRLIGECKIQQVSFDNLKQTIESLTRAVENPSEIEVTTGDLSSITFKGLYPTKTIVIDKVGSVVFVKENDTDIWTTEKMVILEQPIDAHVKQNQMFYFTVNAINVASYKWQYSDNDGATWTHPSWWNGTTTETMSMDCIPSRTAFLYRCELTDAQGNKLYTNPTRLYMI